ncbi:MAG: hypothetical protein JSV61_07140 [Anaerolineales bacterium]|nr:MAG: hypothetical protein JSV61_07140 [Anaerolineales bacterium]
MTDHELAAQTKQLHTQAIMSKPNVVGVGVGEKISKGQKTGEIAVVVLVRQKLPPAGLPEEALLPKEFDGVKTDVIEVGEIRAQQTRTDRWRPAPGGVSIGHYQITAGTLGCIVRDRSDGTRLILSNNHVLANSNDAQPGDAILQPGPADGGSASKDTIAHLERFCPIQFSVSPPTCSLASGFVSFGNFLAELAGSGHRVQAYKAAPQATNLADAAVARPAKDADVLDEILEVGVVSGTLPAGLGMKVRKSGRTTAFTTGEITVLDATVNVSYGAGKVATFENQLVAGPMSQGGDSGSLVVAADELKAVGLLFAGSNQSTIINPIQAALDCLNVDL